MKHEVVQAWTQHRIDRTIKALVHNRFDAYFIPTKEALFAKLDTMLSPGSSCSVGGSETLHQLGVPEYLSDGSWTYYDRYAPGADSQQVFHQALSCDTYLTSVNAVTEDGQLYNVDGRGNRVAAMVYGPQKVIVIAGANKIVPDIDAARRRCREIAAPANAMRLQPATPCAKTGKCIDCSSPARICSFELVCQFQMIPGRISVLLLPDTLGF